MANLNVNRNVDDPFYRYKMPRIIAKVEGKGNGIKTVIVNMPEVAKALSRPPTYPCKFFGCELGAQTQFDLKNDRFIVNGSHEASKLQDLLDGFIKKFVLCVECENPETKLNPSTRKGTISQHCIACGHTGQCDMRHKLTTFILRNPPDQDPATAGTTPSKKDKKGKKNKEKENGEVSPDASQDQDEPDFAAPVIKHTKDPEYNDDDWGDDTSAAAVQARMEELTGAAKSMTVTDDLEKTQSERMDIFYAYIKKKKETGQVTGLENEKDIMGEAERLDVKDKATLILAELLYDANMVVQVKQYRTLFLRFCHENQKAQKYLLGGFELLVGNVHKEALMVKTPHILKMFYDCDIIEEEVMIDWDKKASKKYVSKEVSKEIHSKATAFINWLKEAEEESSGEEDEEEGTIEVVYSHTEKVGTQTIKPPEDSTKKDKEEPEDDDFDIDAI